MPFLSYCYDLLSAVIGDGTVQTTEQQIQSVRRSVPQVWFLVLGMKEHQQIVDWVSWQCQQSMTPSLHVDCRTLEWISSPCTKFSLYT